MSAVAAAPIVRAVAARSFHLVGRDALVGTFARDNAAVLPAVDLLGFVAAVGVVPSDGVVRAGLGFELDQLLVAIETLSDNRAHLGFVDVPNRTRQQQANRKNETHPAQLAAKKESRERGQKRGKPREFHGMRTAQPLRMNPGRATSNVCYVLEKENVMNAAKDSENQRMDERNQAGRKLYPGATLRHLGSVRDVTLAKTKTGGDGFNARHT